MLLLKVYHKTQVPKERDNWNIKLSSFVCNIERMGCLWHEHELTVSPTFRVYHHTQLASNRLCYTIAIITINISTKPKMWAQDHTKYSSTVLTWVQPPLVFQHQWIPFPLCRIWLHPRAPWRTCSGCLAPSSSKRASQGRMQTQTVPVHDEMRKNIY